MYYANQTLCDSTVNVHAGYPERAKDESGLMKAWQSPFILLVDRGGCTFVKKVRNAQRAGAAAVLVADDTCMCSFPDCKPDREGEPCEMEEPIMADDGSGSDISIPAFLLFKQDADPIRDALKQNTQVRVEMSFSLPNPDGRVEYDLWTTPTDVISRPIEQNFKDAAVALGDKAFFTPHMYVYDGIRAGCDQHGTDECGNLCTNAGRYCAIDPDEDLENGISGADVIRESLRRLCVWSLSGDDGLGSSYWTYIKAFNERCNSNTTKPEMFMDADCVSGALATSSIKTSDVEKCMADSGGLEGDVANTLLDKELQAKDKAGIILIPTLFVNQAPVRGSLSFATAFKAICSGYSSGSEPSICHTCAECLDELGCVRAGHCTSGYSSSAGGDVSLSVFVASMMLMMGTLMVFGFVMYKRQQRQMQEQVRGIIAVRCRNSYGRVDVHARLRLSYTLARFVFSLFSTRQQYMPLEQNKVSDTSMGIPDTDHEFS